MASQKGISDYRCPAGGCLLTEPHFAARLRDYFAHVTKPSCAAVPLLKIGRHFRRDSGDLIIVARDEKEGGKMVSLRPLGTKLLVPDGFSAPAVLLEGADVKSAIEKMVEFTNRAIPDNAIILLTDDQGTSRVKLKDHA